MPVEMAPPTYFGNLPAIQPPQSENLLQTAQQVEQLHQAQTMSPYQVQAAQGSIQSQQLQNQQTQMEMDSQRGLMKMYLGAGGNPDSMTPQLAAQNGVLPKDYMAMKNNFLNMAKTKSEVDKNVQDVTDEWHDTLHNAYQPVADEPDPAKQAQMLSTINQGLQQRYPNKSSADLLQWTDPQAFKLAMAAYTTDKWTTAQGAAMRGQAATTQAQTAATRGAAVLPGEQAASDQAQRSDIAAKLGAAPDAATYDRLRDASGQAPLFPSSRLVFDPTGKQWLPGQQTAVQRVGMNSEQRTQADQAAANAAQNALPKTEPELALILNDPTKPQAVRDAARAALNTLTQAKIAARPVTNINTTAPGLGPGGPDTSKLTGDDYLNALPPGTSAQVKAIAEGRAVMPSAASRSQAAMQLRNAVFQYDPSYSDQRAQIRRALTTGIDGRNIGNLNTAAVHLDQLGEISKAMDNGTFQPGTNLWNQAVTMFGGAAPTNYEGLRQAVAGEMDAALHGTSTIPGRDAIAATMPAKSAPGQMTGIIDTNLRTLGAKLNTYEQRYRQQSPGDQVWSPVLPAARGVFQKHGFDPTAPAGQTAAPKFKVGDSVMYQGKPHKVSAVEPTTGKLTIEP